MQEKGKQFLDDHLHKSPRDVSQARPRMYTSIELDASRVLLDRRSPLTPYFPVRT